MKISWPSLSLLFKFSLSFIFLLLTSNISFSQDHPVSYFYENEFNFSIPLKNKLSMDIGLGNRGMILSQSASERISDYQHQHIEIEQFTNYQIKEYLVGSIGAKYRFREMFSTSKVDEFRLMEELELQANSIWSHRIRLEQRFRKNTTHRARYNIEYSTPIRKDWTFILGTEFLYSISKRLKPEAEQRFSAGIETSVFKDINLGVNAEYRMENYARDLSHEVFLVSSFELNF